MAWSLTLIELLTSRHVTSIISFNPYSNLNKLLFYLCFVDEKMMTPSGDILPGSDTYSNWDLQKHPTALWTVAFDESPPWVFAQHSRKVVIAWAVPASELKGPWVLLALPGSTHEGCYSQGSLSWRSLQNLRAADLDGTDATVKR